MLTINRNNYETWLILYLDNELAVSERQAVEAFCAAHPDVQEEFESLKEVLLQQEVPELMPGKERLLMPELWDEETLTPQQQLLLSMADNELPQGDKVLLENEIDSNPMLQQEWALMQKTILASENPAEMPGKQALYRREDVRVIPIGRIIQWAVAAAIIGFGWFFIQELSGKQPRESSNDQALAVEESGVSRVQKAPTPGPVTLNKESVVEANKSLQKEITMELSQEKKPFMPAMDNKTVAGKESEKSPQEMLLANNTLKNETDLTNRDIAEKIPSVTYVDVVGVDAVESISVPNMVTVESAVAKEEPQATETYEMINANEIDADASISIAGARISKQKIRNVYRNITRPLARTFEKTPAPRTEIR